MEALSGEFPCHAVDLRGFGRPYERTRLPEAADEVSRYSLDSMASDVAGFVSNFGINRYVLVGHSMGGKVALALAASHGCPPGLEAVALVAPSPPTPEPMPDEERARLLAGAGSETTARETLAKITARPLPPEQAERVIEDETSVVPAAWRAWLERGSRVDISARLERIKVPVLLLAGAEDANITARLLQREIADRLPSASARAPETVPGAAHLLPLEAPAAVADFIRRAVA